MEKVTFETEDRVILEGEIHRPEGPPVAPALVCHAHPQFGGSKDHPLLWGIRIGLTAAGFAVLSFNFRGVMGSGGAYGGGEHEVKDVRAAVGLMRHQFDRDVFQCGWSFGAHVALREATDDERVRALALVGLPLGQAGNDVPPLPDLPPPDRLAALHAPVLLLSGAKDPFSPLTELQKLGELLPRATVEVVPEADHYFKKQEREAGRIVAAFAGESLR